MSRHRHFILNPMLALLALAVFAGHAEAANTLTVNCTFTIAKDVHIVWSGATSGVGNISWPLSSAVLGQSYSTVGTGDGWAWATNNPLAITNNSLTGDGVDLSLTASCSDGGWATAATTGTANQYVAACTANNTPPANTAAVLSAGGAILNPTNAAFASNVAATASTASLWFALTLPTSITTGGNIARTVSYVFTGTAH